MKLKVEHTTTFTYDLPVHETATEVRMEPLEPIDPGNRLVAYCLDFQLHLSPRPTRVSRYIDFYGNKVHNFNLLQSHKKLEISAQILVETDNTPIDFSDDIVLREEFMLESRFVEIGPAIREFADQFARINHVMGKCEAICTGVYNMLAYERGVTQVGSSSTHAMEVGSGVCQDFAHVMIAACRYLRIPARYVSGYLYGGSNTDAFDRASHAWVEVYSGPNEGWVPLDPTHNRHRITNYYIKVGSGRDYADVSLIRGTYKGNADETMEAIVRITSV